MNTGDFKHRGKSLGKGFNLNIPLPPGSGQKSYIKVMKNLVIPEIERYHPDLIIVACGYDASGVDPLSRMMCYGETFRTLT